MNRLTIFPTPRQLKGFAYCPICTHTVQTQVVQLGKRAWVRPGEKCPRCTSSLEAAPVLHGLMAA